MKANLLFIREYRKPLRIKVNAAEDLMLNQVREPEDRGLCLHLLSKDPDFKAFAPFKRGCFPRSLPCTTPCP